MTESRPPQKTLEEILEIVQRLDKQINPPLWKKVVRFMFSHVLVLSALVVILYGVWQIWDVVVLISGLVSRGFDSVDVIRNQGGAIIEQGRDLLPF